MALSHARMAPCRKCKKREPINGAKDYEFGLTQQGKTVPNEWNLGDWIRNQLPQGYVNPLR